MLGAIAAKELTEFGRDRRLAIIAFALLLLAFAAIGTGALQQARYAAERDTAVATDQEIWHGQGAVNPHSAAHMGQYAFKPRAPLALFDPGLSPWLGEAIWLEAHYQNPPQARPAQTSNLIQRFGDLSPAWVLQAMLPLLIVMSGFAMVAGERERGSLRLQMIQGSKALPLLLGKAGALLAGAALVVVVLLAAAGVAVSWTTGWTGDAGARWFGLLVAYLLYAAIWVGMTVSVSAFAATARQALLVLLTVWAVAIVLVPRLAAEQATAAHPIPAAGAFWEAVRVAREQGIDGHNPGDARAKALEAQVLAQYGVASVDDLPIDFAGISLQAGEDYGNQVFDRLYGGIIASENAQVAAQTWFAPLSPLIGIRALSMGMAGNDLVHQQQFTAAAEAHRRTVQRQLNAEQARTGKGQNFNNKAPPEFWQRVPTFIYQAPSIASVGGRYVTPWVVTLAWLAGVAALFGLAAARLEKRA